MLDLGTIFVILALIVIIVIQAVERHATLNKQIEREDKLLDEISRANKAIISKSAHDYVMMTAMDKTVKEDEKPKDPNEADMSELTDDAFDKMIEQHNAS